MSDVVGKRVKLLVPVRASSGKEYFIEHPKIVRITKNLDRTMYLVKWDDDASTFLFPDEVEILE